MEYQHQDITEEDLQKLYEDCISYEKEYDDAYNSIKWPTETELRIKAGAYKACLERMYYQA